MKKIQTITIVKEKEEMEKNKSAVDSNETTIQESGTEKVQIATVLKEEEEMAKTQSIEDSNETIIQESGTEKVQIATVLKEKEEMAKTNKKKSSKASNGRENCLAEVSTKKANDSQEWILEPQTDYVSQICSKYPELKPIFENIQKLALENPIADLDEFCKYNFRVLRGFMVSNKGYARYITDNLKVREAGKAFRVSELIRNADTGYYSVNLEIYNQYDGVRQIDGVSMSISVKDLEKLLCDNGCVVMDAKLTHQYFRYQVDFAMQGVIQKPLRVIGEDGKIIYAVWSVVLGNIPMLSIVHSERIGWDTDKTSKKLVFKGKHIYTADDTYSDYKGDFMIGEEGDYKKYLSMLRKEVIGNTPLEAALAFAASAILLGFMNRVYALSLPNPIVHLYGDSTSGKTTTFILMISLGGMPERSEKSSMETFFTTFNGTPDSLLKVVGDNNGFLFGIDELSMSNMTSKERERILYALTGGQDKKRLLRDGSKLQQGVDFETTIVTNGEESIMPHNGAKQGCLNRVFEFACVEWTKSAANAKKIQTACKKNYGFVTPKLAQYLLRLDEKQRNQLLDSYQKWKKKFIAHAKRKKIYDEYTERLSETLALFMVSLECFGKVTKLTLHYKEVFDFLFDHIIVKEADKTKMGIRAFQHFLSVYNHERDAFWDFKSSPSVGSGKKFLGSLIDKRTPKVIKAVGYGDFTSSRHIGLTREHAEEIFVQRGKFSDVKVVMKELHKMGVLYPKDVDREIAKPFVFGTLEIKDGYAIHIPDDVYVGYDVDADGDPTIQR